LIGEASGPLIYFPMRWSMAEEASAYAAAVAETMGLVCFDDSRTGSGREESRQSAVADEGCGYADESEEVFGLAFIAAVETAAAGQPGPSGGSVRLHGSCARTQ
jgi:hypothetical protein